MDDNTPDIPLENFGADTEVVASPAQSDESSQAHDEQTTQPEESNGSEQQVAQPVTDNPIEESRESGRPEKQDRLQARFGELTSTIRQKDEYIEQLSAQIARAQAMQGVKPLMPNENGEYDIEAIQANQAQLADASARAQVSQLESRLERESIANRYDQEGTLIETKYAKDFESNPVHLQNIQEMIAEAIDMNKFNQQALKQISPLKIAERYMKGIESERRKAQSSTAANLQTIQAESAISPEGAPSSLDPNSEDALEARVSNIKF
jgi:hypothetical protein